MKHTLIPVTALLLAPLAALNAADAPRPAGKPNIIVILTDDQGDADLSCQRQVPDIKTPNLDFLAWQGVRQTAGYVTAPQETQGTDTPGGAHAGVSAPAEQRPNVIFIVVDDLGYGELGCYGGKDIPTPQIDALAASGARFTSGYVTAIPSARRTLRRASACPSRRRPSRIDCVTRAMRRDWWASGISVARRSFIRSGAALMSSSAFCTRVIFMCRNRGRA